VESAKRRRPEAKREGREKDLRNQAEAYGNLARKVGVSRAFTQGQRQTEWAKIRANARRRDALVAEPLERGEWSVVCPAADLGSRVLREEGQAFVKR
jgi:hypothetical protein